MDNYLDDSYPGVKYPNKRNGEQLTLRRRNKSESDNMKLVLEDDAEEDRERKMRIMIDKVGTER